MGWAIVDRHGIFDTYADERVPESPKSLNLANREGREAILVRRSRMRAMEHKVVLELVVSG